MPRDNFIRWDFGQAIASVVDEDGWLTVQGDAYGEESSGTQPMLMYSPYGLLSRPQDPDDEGSCHAMMAHEGDQGYILPTLDKRVLEKLPALNKGASVQYGSDGGFGQFDPKTHTYTLYIPVEFDGDGKPTKAHAITVGKASDGTDLLSIVHANGLAIQMQDDEKHSLVLKNASGSASWTLDDSGTTIAGTLRLTGGLVTGQGPTPAKPLVTLDGLLAYLTLLEGAIAAKQPAGPVPSPAVGLAATFTATAASST